MQRGAIKLLDNRKPPDGKGRVLYSGKIELLLTHLSDAGSKVD